MITTEQFELIVRVAKAYTDVYQKLSHGTLITMMCRAHGLGLPFTEGPEIFQIVSGKLALSANGQATLMRRAGYSWTVDDLSDDSVQLTIYAPDGRELGQSVFTMQDAKQAGLKGGNWDKYPRNMMMARALSNAVKWFAPDATGGAALYTADELGDDSVEAIDIIEDTEPDTPPPANVVDMPDDFLDVPDEPGDTHAPVGDKGNLTDHNRKQLFAVGNEWAPLLRKQSYDKVRTKHAQEILGNDLESFGQLNNAGAKLLILRMERDIVTELGMQAYKNWLEEKESELCRAVSKDTADSVDECNRSELVRLKAGIKARLDAREDAEEKEIA